MVGAKASLKRIAFLLFAGLIFGNSVSHGQIPPPENDEFIEGDEEYLDEPPPPPPPPPDSFNNSGLDNPAVPPPRFGGSSNPGGTGGPGTGGPRIRSTRKESAPKPAGPPAQQSASGVKFSEAQPEDITNENYPDLIDSFDYPNAEITDVVKAISKLTGKNFILDTNVRGKITIMAPTQITVAEAYKAFLSALAINGFTVVPSGKFLKIRPSSRAQQESIETYAGGYFPNTDQFITRIIKLKYISAEEIQKQLRTLASKDGKMDPFSQTNSLIITDFGTNIARIQSIIDQLDVPGFEEKLEVIKIVNAKAKDIADLVDQIINKESSGRRGSSTPRFRPVGQSQSTGAKGAESYSLVTPDERTNSIIVVGNQAGISKIKELVRKLDFPLRPEDSGGVFVYYVRFGEAEQIGNVLNGIASDVKAQKGKDEGITPPGINAPPPPISGSGNRTNVSGGSDVGNAVFGGDVKVTADKITNSLVITASRQDYEVVKSILAKLDIARDQVFIKTIIMEMLASDNFGWNVNAYQFNADSNGIGRIGFTGGGLTNAIDPTKDTGFTFGLGTGETFDLKVGSTTIASGIPSLIGLINIFKTKLKGDVLSTPQLLAMDNEEAEIEVGQTVADQAQQTTGAGGTIVATPQRLNAFLKINVTPYISPDSDKIRIKYVQTIKQLVRSQTTGATAAPSSPSTDDRNLKTVINVESGETIVLGGLMTDRETVEETKVPLLGDIPILGWLFKSRRVDKEKRNLVVFLTPQIIRNSQDADKVLEDKFNERIDFVQRNLNGRDPYGSIIDSLPRKSKNRPQSPTSTSPTDQFQEEPATETF